MLTKKERNLIKSVYYTATLSKWFFTAAMLSVLFILIFGFITGFIFTAPVELMFLQVLIWAICGILGFVFWGIDITYSMMYITRSEKYGALLKEASINVDKKGIIESAQMIYSRNVIAGFLFRLMRILLYIPLFKWAWETSVMAEKKSQLVADYYKIKLHKGCGKIVIVIPVITFLTIIPVSMTGYKMQQERIDVLTENSNALIKEFESSCDKVVDFNIIDGRTEFVDITAYITNPDNDLESYVKVVMNEEGKITEIHYGMDVDKTASKGENLENYKKVIEIFHECILNSNIPADSDFLLDSPTLPEEFLKLFMEQDYDEEIFIQDNTDIYWNRYSYGDNLTIILNLK